MVQRTGLCCAKKVSQKSKSSVRNRMTYEKVGGKAIRYNCLADRELRRTEKTGEFQRKCRFGFSKALIADGDISLIRIELFPPRLFGDTLFGHCKKVSFFVSAHGLA